MSKLINSFKQLSEACGISGNEKHVAKLVAGFSKPYVDEITYDNLGSVITKKGSVGPKVALVAHLDEIGLMVTNILPNGFIKFQVIGGWFSQVMLAQQWQIHTPKGIVYAVTGVKPPHMIPLDQRSKAIDIETMYLDIGAKTKEDAIAAGVEIGAMVTPDATFRQLIDPNLVVGKAFDNRVGSLILIEVMKQINPTKVQVYGVHTVQEEVGLRGAKTSSFKVNPDLAIAVDTGVGNDVPGGDADGTTLGKGPQLLIYDVGLIGHPKLRSYIKKIASDSNIACQETFLRRGQTDAAAYSLSHDGAPSVALGVPTRYMHSHTGILDMTDVENTIKLLVEVINSLDQKEIDEITFN